MIMIASSWSKNTFNHLMYVVQPSAALSQFNEPCLALGGTYFPSEALTHGLE